MSAIAEKPSSTIDLAKAATWTPTEWAERIRQNRDTEDWIHAFFTQIQDDKRKVALAYYEPMNPMAEPVHRSTAREIAIVGGNRSGKTETMLVELIIQATGHIPEALQATYPREKIRPPIRARVVCNSLTDTLEPIIKPKLRWDQWSGTGEPGQGLGHFGWVPERCLVGGTWEKAYSEKYRTLKLRIDNYWTGPKGEQYQYGAISSIQFLSYDQDLTAFSGSSMHFVGHDELPPSDIYRENRMRTLDVHGQVMTAFTPPDEAGASALDVAWFFDEVYEKGLPGPGKAPNVDTFILWTEKNRILSSKDVEEIARTLTEDQRQARLYGQFLHLSGVVYPLFAHYPTWWCFRCVKKARGRICDECNGDDTTEYAHVIDPMTIPKNWPIVFVIDPHPRKKDACGWFAIAPSDTVIMIGELEASGDAGDVARQVFDYEKLHDIRPMRRLMDPNIATETNDRLERGWTLRSAYDKVQLRCDLANDSIPIGIQNVNELLKPDKLTRMPRFQAFRTNRKFIYGMTHWSWDEWTRQKDRDVKEITRDRHKDFPDLLRYLANDLPSYRQYQRIVGSGSTKREIPSGGY